MFNHKQKASTFYITTLEQINSFDSRQKLRVCIRIYDKKNFDYCYYLKKNCTAKYIKEQLEKQKHLMQNNNIVLCASKIIPVP